MHAPQPHEGPSPGPCAAFAQPQAPATRRLRLGRSTVTAAALAVLAGASGLAAIAPAGCAKVNSGGGGTGSVSGGGGSFFGTGGRGQTGGGGNSGTGLVTGDAAVGVCQEGMYKSVPQIPTVYVMVDRSGSMFHCLTTNTGDAVCSTPSDTSWNKLQSAVLNVIGSLQTSVRFGFAAFTGQNPNAGVPGAICPIINKVAPALNNRDAIAAVYGTLPFPPNSTQSGVKFETPARQSLDMIGAELLADPTPGSKYILFVTDGQPDYCDDANSLCAPDSVIAGLQGLKTQGITTVVMGLQTVSFDLPAGILQGFANAGAGEPTVAPLPAAGNLDTFAFFDQCNGVAGWHADLVASGKTQVRGVTLGTYSPTAGPTQPFTPDPSNQTMLLNQLSLALAGVKSCVFDLNNLNGQKLTVDTTMLSQVTVKVMGATVPLDPVNGWHMSSASELELVGSACDSWRMPDNTLIDIQIPCSVIIIQ